ncbi:ArsR/SmtB family transcription factor [Nakamurella endophytica]|uniref:Transcriptional regulator n=1 Tax=Nakamurella endophytica TaxID=1748367 RepID=A0A917SKC2_9ACTN|nr:metalloregulator ArsR/SmtB family transcription factor [Nakamurella endophytica]GGL85628.1 transcriptional regulator [Nakamurella endophytica]
MHVFDVLADPVRRRVLDLLSAGPASAGTVTAAVVAEFGITQPAVSRQLRVLRDAGFVDVTPDGTRRVYRLRGETLREVDDWLRPYRRFWEPRLDALATEVARGRRDRRAADASAGPRGAADGRNATGAAS